jgi:GNAT superfamily N-acetyltransferase
MDLPDALIRHLRESLGTWPPARQGVTVVGSVRRITSGWDGSVRPVVGVSTPTATVLSVPPDRVEAVSALAGDLDTIAGGIAAALERPDGRFFTGVFRWSDSPATTPDRGVWVATDDPRVPEWLRPFNGDVLVGFEGDAVAAGVGRKQHDRWGHELAVVTEPDHRGRGWASDLVAQAARRVLADGAIPTYLHAPNNAPSARTADTAGFPDRGWRVHGFGGQAAGHPGDQSG